MSHSDRSTVFALIVVFLTIASGPASAQRQPVETVEAVRSAVDTGDAAALQRLAGDRLEVGLFGAARLYSNSQAGYVLEGFFRENPPARLVIGETMATETAWFAAAEYHRVGGRPPLRVYLRLRRAESGWVLREFVVLRPIRQ